MALLSSIRIAKLTVDTNIMVVDSFLTLPPKEDITLKGPAIVPTYEWRHTNIESRQRRILTILKSESLSTSRTNMHVTMGPSDENRDRLV